MRGNSFGKMLSITSFGESHGPAIGVVVDGVPSNLSFSYDDLREELKKRAPGRIDGTSERKEVDTPEILSGIFEGKTLGTPIAVIIKNNDQRSEDYHHLKNTFRPGHADETTMIKYGIRDHRGGGRSSGRETIARVVGGYFASLIIRDVSIKAYIKSMGPFNINNNTNEDTDAILNNSLGDYHYPDQSKWDEIKEYLLKLKQNGESVGGSVGVIIDNPPKGLGEPVFDKLKADIAKAMLSIGGATAISFTQNLTKTAGIAGGISNGERILFEVTFKAPATTGESARKGRHDPTILVRVILVIESMIKLVLADHYLRQLAYANFKA
ncbi:MAG: chorismate synthase [Oligoflexia bacterium]|nr:chorismate synthase [Oligoflexia bacterium]